MLEFFFVVILIILILWSVINWFVTAPAFAKRLKKADEKGLNATSEIIKFIFAPLLSLVSLMVAGLTGLLRLLAKPLLFIFSPFMLLGILIAFYPRVLELFLRKLGFFGEEILKYNEELPQRAIKSSQAGWNSFWGSFALLFTRRPFKSLLSDPKSIHVFEVLGLQERALSVLRAQVLDSHQDLENRLEAVQTLAQENQLNDLLNILRARDIQPEVARKIVHCLKDAQRLPEVIQAWNLLCTHNQPEMQLEAAQNLLEFNQSRRAATVILRLARDVAVDEKTRVHAAELLGRQNLLETAEPILQQVMEQGQNESVCLAAAEALWRLTRSETALAGIYRYLDTNLGFEIRKQAIQSLGKLQLKRDLLQVKTNPYLQPEDWREAVYALENCEETCTAFVSWISLARNVKVPTPLRREALQAAARLGENQMQQMDRKAQNRIRDYLTVIGRHTFAPADLRLQAGKTLERLGWSQEASDLYLSLANPKNPDQGVRKQAEKAVKQLEIQLQGSAS